MKNPSLNEKCYWREITLKGCKLQIQNWHPQHYSCTTSLTTVTCWISKCLFHLFVLESNQTRSLVLFPYLSVCCYFCCTVDSKLKSLLKSISCISCKLCFFHHLHCCGSRTNFRACSIKWNEFKTQPLLICHLCSIQVT